MEYNEFIHHILNITMVEFKGQVDPVEPLLLCHMPGIPKKSRRRELGEPTARVKIAKSRSTIRCNFNLKLGHNKEIVLYLLLEAIKRLMLRLLPYDKGDFKVDFYRLRLLTQNYGSTFQK